MNNMTPEQALEILFQQAIQSRLLPPAALPELQQATQILKDALQPKEQEKKK